MPAIATPLSPLPFEGQIVSLPDAVTVVEASPAPYSNTNEVLILNTSASDAILVQVAVVSGGLPGTIGTDSTIVPAGSEVTLTIGTEGDRNPLATSAFWAANTGSGLNIVFQAATATGTMPLLVNVTYVQKRGGAGGGS